MKVLEMSPEIESAWGDICPCVGKRMVGEFGDYCAIVRMEVDHFEGGKARFHWVDDEQYVQNGVVSVRELTPHEALRFGVASAEQGRVGPRIKAMLAPA